MVDIPMPAPAEVYQRRRARLAAQLEKPLVIFAGHAPARNYPANTYPFRAASTYLYFGGPKLENAALIIQPGGDGVAGVTLIRHRTGIDEDVWGGATPPDELLAGAAGLPAGKLAEPDELRRIAGPGAAFIAPLAMSTLQQAEAAGLTPAGAAESRSIIDLRLIKDEHELAAMRRAAEIGIRAHRAALAACRPGRREADVNAAYMAALTAGQCEVSFNSIITVHGEVLHSEGFANVIPPGALLLIDAGPEEPGGYATDITRTAPVDGRFTPIQRQMYDTVLRANREATAACVPGARFRDVHDLAARAICEGLVAAELLRGDPGELFTRKAHTLFFTHGLGHLIGLDVHDMEDFGDLAGYAPGRTRRPAFGDKFLRLDRDLEPGYCLTIEPGVYLVPAIFEYEELVRPVRDAINWPKVRALLRDRFGGIRIENTICVRAAGGPEVLTGALPVDGDEVAKMVGTG